MSIIDKTYFDDLDINVPDNEAETLTASITKYEPEILRLAMGSTLYELMTANASASPYKEIMDGKDYTVEQGGVTYTVKWNGLKNTDKISLIAYYVYYWWQRNHASLTAYSGEIKPGYENAAQASMAMKISNAWMRLKKLYGFYGQDELEPSLWNFLNEHEADYPTWVFKALGSVNSFDL